MNLKEFVRESNRIEGILREPLDTEVEALEDFLSLDTIRITDLMGFVSINQPGAVLRDRPGLDVRVGNHIPISGGASVVARLGVILDNESSPWQQHIDYEILHPFTDGNGRSGRALWLWRMREAPLGFLHTFYYQTLENVGR